ncbi:MAG TPA: tRNA 2-selenouridine(34) synthase MnmH [Chitinophagales bacterium]|nr:tRNA 2-selenouridine(34) synthase MnmH [Chitinophagales bacterium]
MIHQLSIDDFLLQSKGHLVLDVRSEGEFNYGHILNATSLPLFNNEERKIVGTSYKQQGKNEAILLGLDIVGKKMSEFVRFVQPLLKDNKVFVHCWRGGMRSGSMAWLLNLFGYEVYVLKGGYKAYRHHVLEALAKNFNYIVIGGRTGSGKTKVLAELRQMGEQVVDLEDLANHKGSAFGALGQQKQPSTEHFENLLAEELKRFDVDKRVWLEDESKTIGKVFLDLNFWNHLRLSPLFAIELPVAIRVEKLIEEYGHFSGEELKASFANIERRLGNEQWKNAIAAIEEKDLKKATEIALRYYDKAYDKGIAMKETKEVYRFSFEQQNFKTIAATLIEEAGKKYGN